MFLLLVSCRWLWELVHIWNTVRDYLVPGFHRQLLKQSIVLFQYVKFTLLILTKVSSCLTSHQIRVIIKFNLLCSQPKRMLWVLKRTVSMTVLLKTINTFYNQGYSIFRSWHHFLFLDNIEKIKKILSQVLNTFENIMENGAFAPFSIIFSNAWYFKGVIMELRVNRWIRKWSQF